MPRPLPPAVLWPLSLVVGTALFFASNLLEPAATATLNFGTEYAVMAQDPWAFVGKFPHRIVAPLLGQWLDAIAHWFGGTLPYWQFSHGCLVVFLAVVFAACVRFGANVAQALLLGAAIACTGAAQLYKGHVGYPEPVTFALLLGTMMASGRPVVFWALQFLNVMHHEQILFFWPWLLWWRHHRGPARWRDDAIGGALVFGLYVAWRLYVGAHLTEEQVRTGLSMRHYLGLDYFPVGTLGLAALNALATFVWFGLWPIAIVWHAAHDGWRRAGLPLLLFVVSLHAIFGVAHDVYRFTCFLCVPLLLAGLRLFQVRGGTWLVFAFGALSALAVELQAPVFAEVGTNVLAELDANGTPVKVREHIVMDIVPKVIPLLPWTFASYGLALLATLGLGIAWGRRSARGECRTEPRALQVPRGMLR